MKTLKKLMAAILALSLLIIVTACVPQTKNGDEIMTDISASDIMTEIYPAFNVTDVGIIDRVTDENAGQDTMYALTTIVNNDNTIEGKLDLYVEYQLQDKEWIMTTCEFNYDESGYSNPASFSAIGGAELEYSEIESTLYSHFSSATELNINDYSTEPLDEYGYLYSYVNTTVKHKYATIEYDLKLCKGINTSTGEWTDLFVETEEIVSEDWNIDGTYTTKGRLTKPSGEYRVITYSKTFSSGSPIINLEYTENLNTKYYSADDTLKSESSGKTNKHTMTTLFDFCDFDSILVNNLFRGQDYQNEMGYVNNQRVIDLGTMISVYGYSIVVEDADKYEYFSLSAYDDTLFFFGKDSIAICPYNNWAKQDDINKTFTYRTLELEAQ